MFKNNKRGSLTVEACIAFPVFLFFFFMLIFFVKFACINITLNHAVSETAKQLATTCYPISFINEIEDEQAENSEKYNLPSFVEEKNKIKEYTVDGARTELSKYLSGEVTEFNINDTVNSLAKNIVGNVKSDYQNGLRGFLYKSLEGKYYDIKAKAKYIAASQLMKSFYEGSYVNNKKLEFLLVELPQADAEFERRNNDSQYKNVCRDIGYFPGKDDVVVAVEYKTNIPLPFYGKKEISLRHVAVEKAWLHGGNGLSSDVVGDGSDTGSNSDDNGKSNYDEDEQDDKKEKIVYVTKTGIRYHKSGCRHLARSKIAIDINEAVEQGYTPCKVCYKK